MNTWPSKIKNLREDHDLTQKELADKLGISDRTISRYESGDNEPTISILLKLSQIFNISIDRIACNNNPKLNDNIDTYNKNRKIKAKLDKIMEDLRSIYKDCEM